MVAYDSRRPPTPLSDATRELLRVAIVDALGRNGEGGPPLRDALRAAANEARERSMRPEELIIELKHIFASVIHGRAVSLAGDENKLREWLVTNCLKSYYGKGE